MQAYKSKRERDSAHESHYSAKFQKRYVDQQRREHEDQLRYFQVRDDIKISGKFAIRSSFKIGGREGVQWRWLFKIAETSQNKIYAM